MREDERGRERKRVEERGGAMRCEGIKEEGRRRRKWGKK